MYCLLSHTLLLLRIQLGFAEDKEVVGAKEYDKAKEKAGFIAGKHIVKKSDWWFQRSNKGWYEEEKKDAPSSGS
jgi:hypothetical protein